MNRGSGTVDAAQHIALDLIALVMLASGLAKAFDVRAFRNNLQFLPYVPIPATYAVGYGLPLVEVLLACGLYLNVSGAKLVAAGLLAAFCAVTLTVLRKGLRVPCHCFGALSEREFSAKVLWQNLGLIALVLLTLPLERRSLWVQSPVAAAGLLLLWLSGAAVWENRLKMAPPAGYGRARR